MRNDQLTAAFVNTVRPAPSVTALNGQCHRYGLALTVRPSSVEYRHQHHYINRYPTQPARRLVLGVSKMAERKDCTPFPSLSATPYTHRR
ncbi:MAG: hypothetical protein F4Z57_01975 [Gemmatimonadetes bacterium]|nr:hypothetical protein [Gemmatimonadota bacterium]